DDLHPILDPHHAQILRADLRAARLLREPQLGAHRDSVDDLDRHVQCGLLVVSGELDLDLRGEVAVPDLHRLFVAAPGFSEVEVDHFRWHPITFSINYSITDKDNRSTNVSTWTYPETTGNTTRRRSGAETPLFRPRSHGTPRRNRT